jgi:hypothetical protein
VPHVRCELFQDELLPPLSLNEFEDVILKIEAHTTRLREVHQQPASLLADRPDKAVRPMP